MHDRRIVIEESETKVSVQVEGKGNKQDAENKDRTAMAINIWGIDILLTQLKKELGIKDEDKLSGFLDYLLEDLKKSRPEDEPEVVPVED